jgi:hypothetical protein
MKENTMPQLALSLSLPACCSVAALMLPLPGRAADTFVPADFARPTLCPAHFEHQPADGSCRPIAGRSAKIAGTRCQGHVQLRGRPRFERAG